MLVMVAMIESQDGNLKPKEPLLSSRTTQHQMLISSRELDLRLAHLGFSAPLNVKTIRPRRPEMS